MRPAIKNVLCFIFCLAPWPLNAASTVEYNTYKVQGKTVHELFLAITVNSPIGSSGLTTKTPGKTSWDYTVDANGMYLFKSLEVDQHITVTIPEWEKPDNASSCMIETWDDLIDALKQHEDHHKDIFLSLQPRVEAQARNIPPQKNIDDLFNAIDRIWKQVISEISAEQIRYDERTNHGQTEGIVLGPC